MNKFLAEIMEQPEAVEATLSYYLSDRGKRELKNIRQMLEKERPEQIIFTGMGSSYFASYAASYLFNSMGIRSYAMNSSELLYYHFPVIGRKTAVVCVSQSGESFEVVRLLEKLPKDILCIGVSNEAKSSLSMRAVTVLRSRAGREEMTSTKTYTTITLVMFILGWYLGDAWGREKVRQIRRMCAGMEKMLNRREKLIDDVKGFLGKVDFIQFIGRGPAFSTAVQSELMFKEAAKVAAAGTLGGEFRHGPMEMVGASFKSVLFAAEGKTYSQSIKMARDIGKYHGKVVLISNKASLGANDENVKTIAIDQPDEYLFSIQSIIPVQLLVNALALTNGHEPGRFLHGGKVTLTE